MSVQHIGIQRGSVHLSYSAEADPGGPEATRERLHEAMEELCRTLGYLDGPTESNGNISTTPEDRQDPEEDTRTPGQKAAATRKANKVKKDAENAERKADQENEDHELGAPEDDTDLIDMNEPVSEPAVTSDETEENFDEISDSELQTELNKKIKALKAGGRADAVMLVKAVIASFNTDEAENWTAGMMSQAQRRKFLVKLGAINDDINSGD